MPLTPKQAKFARFIADGISQKDAALAAGYANPSGSNALSVAASRLMQHPDIQRAAFEQREARLAGPLAKKALATLEGILDDEAAPAAARVQACRFVLEAAGHGIENRRILARNPDDGDKPLSQRTQAELEEFIFRQEGVIAGLRSVNPPVINAGET